MRHRSSALASLEGLAGSASNSAFVGYPIILQVVGPAAGTALGLGALVENVLMIPLGLAVANAKPGETSRMWRSQTDTALRGLLRNPMFAESC